MKTDRRGNFKVFAGARPVFSVACDGCEGVKMYVSKRAVHVFLSLLEKSITHTYHSKSRWPISHDMLRYATSNMPCHHSVNTSLYDQAVFLPLINSS